MTVLTSGEPVEVTTFRTEGRLRRRPAALEGRVPPEIEADLSRRDFTINAMAFDPIGRRLVDPFGGQADLQRQPVRCVRDAFERFSEDGLRPLRAVRFATVLEFALDPGTEAAIPRTLASSPRSPPSACSRSSSSSCSPAHPARAAAAARPHRPARAFPALRRWTPRSPSARRPRAEPWRQSAWRCSSWASRAARRARAAQVPDPVAAEEVRAHRPRRAAPPDGDRRALRRWMAAVGPRRGAPASRSPARCAGAVGGLHATRRIDLAGPRAARAVRELALQGRESWPRSASALAARRRGRPASVGAGARRSASNTPAGLPVAAKVGERLRARELPTGLSTGLSAWAVSPVGVSAFVEASWELQF